MHISRFLVVILGLTLVAALAPAFGEKACASGTGAGIANPGLDRSSDLAMGSKQKESSSATKGETDMSTRGATTREGGATDKGTTRGGGTTGSDTTTSGGTGGGTTSGGAASGGATSGGGR